MRLRPLWMLLAAILWVAFVLAWTPALDDGAAWLGERADVRPVDVGAALVWAVPWLLAGLALPAAFLVWVYKQPAWHPWRDAVLGALFGAAGAVAPYLLVNRLDLTRFGHYGHTRVDIPEAQVYFIAIAAGVTIAAAVPTALAAANRIWATPTPLREEVFGPRGRPL